MVDQITDNIKQAAQETRRTGGLRTLFRAKLAGWIFGPIVALIFFPTALLLFFCMMPTVVAYIVDPYREKYGARSVGYMNIAGSFAPGWFLWTNDNSIGGAVQLISNLPLMVFVYLSALVGWGIYWVIPKIVLTYLNVALEVRLRSAKIQRLELVRNWGADIAEDAAAVLAGEEANKEIIVPKKKTRTFLGKMRFWEGIMDRAKVETEQAIAEHRQQAIARMKTLQSQLDKKVLINAVASSEEAGLQTPKIETAGTHKTQESEADQTLEFDDRIRHAQLQGSETE